MSDFTTNPSGHRSGHLCGKVGKVTTVASKPDLSKPGSEEHIPLSRVERYWIQVKIQRIPNGERTDLERKLLKKVEL